MYRPSDPEVDAKGEYISRYCKYDLETRDGVWLTEDSSACSSVVSAEVNAAVDGLKTLDIGVSLTRY